MGRLKKILGAFLHAGVPAEHLKAELQKIPLPDAYEITIDKVNKKGISALYVNVSLDHQHDGLHLSD